MSQFADNVRKDLIRMVPLSIVNEISCFVFYDHHPKDEKNIDITICTIRGEVKEFYQRELVQSTFLDTTLIPTEIGILRNSKCDLFYFIVIEDELVILSRNDKLKVHQRVPNVEAFDVNDLVCGGLANLKIVRKDDAVPLIFDDDFLNLSDRYAWHDVESDNTLPLLIGLRRKLSEARFSYKANEKVYQRLVSLRQMLAFSTYQKTNQHTEDAVFKTSVEEAALKIKTPKPLIKKCNENIVMVLEVQNKSKESLEDVQILLHNTTRPSLIYNTKLFEKTAKCPFWREKQSQKINQNTEIAIVTVMDLKEINYNLMRKIEFDIVIFYKKDGKEYLKAVDDVVISALDAMGPQFDVLSTIQTESDEQNIMLAVLATTEKTELCLRHIKNSDEPDLDMLNLFCQHLQMDKLPNTNVSLYRNSYNLVSGIMVVFEQDESERMRKDYWTVSLHTRSPAQVLHFINLIHDCIPYQIVVTTTHQKLSPRTEELLDYNEELTSSTSKPNYVGYGTSILNQTAMLLEFLDDCMIKMNASKNPVVKSKVGNEIDLFVGGVSGYLEFRDRIMKEGRKGVESIKRDAAPDSGSEGTIFEID